MKRILSGLVTLMIVLLHITRCTLTTQAANIEFMSPSVILMEASTGKVIFEKNSSERRSPASITKIMTLLLIFDYLDNGKISLDDQIMTSAYAKSMGGSQVFLEEGEIQTLETLIKCIAVASGNDASVAVAEYIAGSEEEFVYLMNKRAGDLGLKNTHFVDCCGLTTSNEHYSTAEDVAVMSRELITRYPDILDYTKIWMEDIVHVTNRGTETFTLASTNKLIKSYEWATGLKTGSTSLAKYCLSATAKKDGLELIAVIMGAPDTKTRFGEAITLLNYGYSVSHMYEDMNRDKLPAVAISGAIEKEVELVYQSDFRYLDITGQDLSQVKKILSIPESCQAPVKQGEVAGEAIYLLSGEKIGTVPILFNSTIPKARYQDFVLKLLWQLFPA